ncbi:hypothetical protein WJX73_002291 [Symbiochloris irregularis]|uniref:Uncharacterized protein n=1 Tax=Symbiochloris irregularis TaxID=706552 RepID=A0AAW1NSV7_9CHLO
MTSHGCSLLTGTAVRPSVASPKAARLSVVRCQAVSEPQKKMLGVGAALLMAGALSFPSTASADIISELKEKSTTNKELNDKKRLATSYANLAQSRTVQDGTCTWPYNWLGCDNFLVAGRVKFLAEDRELECQGKPAALCGEKMQAAKIPKAFTSSPAQQ